jgi:hypothetical protein
MNTPDVIEQPAAPPAVACSDLLGELWTESELRQAKHVLSAVYEGVDAWLTIDEMRALEKRGLVSGLTLKPGRGRYANRYEYMWTDKLEKLVEAIRTSSPNSVLFETIAKTSDEKTLD